MSETRTNAIDAAVAHVEQAMELVGHLHRTPQEGVTTNGIVTVLSDTVRRIEALRGKECE